MLRGKRVVVTGGAGFIGSHIVDRLAEANDVVVFDSLTVGRLQNLAGAKDRIEIVRGSILDPKALSRGFRDADAVFHLAALTSVPESREKPIAYAEANVMGTLNVLTAAGVAGASRVVFASTCAVYGRAGGPLREDRPPDPLSPYAVTKLACEYFCRSAGGEGDVEAVALRLFNVYGPRQAADSPYASVHRGDAGRHVRGRIADAGFRVRRGCGGGVRPRRDGEAGRRGGHQCGIRPRDLHRETSRAHRGDPRPTSEGGPAPTAGGRGDAITGRPVEGPHPPRI